LWLRFGLTALLALFASAISFYSEEIIHLQPWAIVVIISVSAAIAAFPISEWITHHSLQRTTRAIIHVYDR
ncbi:MAG: hypothetical protein LBL92_03570, partial [Propionibacteriaceae bacterium]|nr:hypothetical protein [Propionibacteriaceae bacterium]